MYLLSTNMSAVIASMLACWYYHFAQSTTAQPQRAAIAVDVCVIIFHFHSVFLVLTETIETKLLLLPLARSWCSPNSSCWVYFVCFVHVPFCYQHLIIVCSLSAPSVCLRILIQISLFVMPGGLMVCSLLYCLILCLFSLLRKYYISMGRASVCFDTVQATK